MYDFTCKAMKYYWDQSMFELKQRHFMEEEKIPNISKIDKMITTLDMKGLNTLNRINRK